MEGSQILRFALRGVYEGFGLSLTVMLTVALGVGATTAIFTVDYAALLAPLQYPHPDRLVDVWSNIQGHRNFVSAADLAEWKRRSTVFEQLETAAPDNVNVAGLERAEYLEGMEATTGYCAMLGCRFFLGRNFLPNEGERGAEHVVILTHKLWERLGSNPAILGQRMRIDGEPHTVVGVLASGIADRWGPELLRPLIFTPEQLTDHESHSWVITARMRPRVTIQEAQAEMDAIAAQIEKTYPKTNENWGAIVEPFKNDFFPSERQRTLWLLLGAVGFLLLIACVNVANLLLTKSMRRRREIAIRGALGASSFSIFAQSLSESLILALGGGAFGIGVGQLLLRGLVVAIPTGSLPPEADQRLNLPVLFAMLGATTFVGLAFGCLPAWHSSRINPAESLKEGTRAGTSMSRHQLRRALVIAEFALVLPLLVAAGLATRSLWNLTQLDLGVETSHSFGFYVDSPRLIKNPTQSSINAYYRQLLATISAVPGVSHVAAMSYLPLDSLHAETTFSIAGDAEYANVAMRSTADFQTVTPNYFATFGIRLVRGRVFTDHDDMTSPRVAMVNEAFANRFLKGRDPLGTRLVKEQVIPGEPKQGPLAEWQIVGVFHNVKSRSSREDNPEVDTSFWQEAYPIAGIGIRTTNEPAPMIQIVQAAVNVVDPQAGFALTRTMDQVHGAALSNDRFSVMLLGSFGSVGLLLAGVGLYGVMAFSVTERRRELAIRLALGAAPHRIVTLMVREGAALACVGTAVGLLAAVQVARVMRHVLFDIPAMDYATLGTMSAVTIAVAVLVCYLSARSAALTIPAIGLRSE